MYCSTEETVRVLACSCQVNIIIPFIATATSSIHNRHLDLVQHTGLPSIQFTHTIVFKAHSGKSVGIILFHTFNQIRAELAFPRIAISIIHRLKPLLTLHRSDGIPICQMTEHALQEIALSVELQQGRIKTVLAKFLVKSGSLKKIGRIQRCTAQFGNFGGTARGVRFGIFHRIKFASLFVAFDCFHRLALRFKNFRNFFG
mmetsp:Transcript_7052/g.10372  ORF Transcript_7052/g.10372 Transcript_7052/m.10372 type:complete len:201 (-) Transcript_7052:399-1001(-)